MENLKNACIYIRVSTHDQEELSPDAQKRLILDYSKKNGYIVTDDNIFIDGGISGKKADKRPAFMKMISLAKAKEHPFDVILVWKYSRFARNQEESIVYKSLLKKNNVEVVSVSEPLVDGPFGSLIERIIEWMDEYYSIRLSGEVMRGMTENALRGGYQSTLPLGYKMDKETGIPYIYEPAAIIVKMIYNEYISGKAVVEIARIVNDIGYRTTRGSTFEQRTIKYILENPFYCGIVRWNRQQHESHTLKDKSEWILAEGKHEPLFTKEYWDNVQLLIKQRSRPFKAHSTAGIKHWLSGIIQCSNCYKTLTASVNRENMKITNWQCQAYKKGACGQSHFIKHDELLKAVLNSLEYVLTSNNISFEYKPVHKETSTYDDTIIKQQLLAVASKEARIKQAYIDGIDTIDEYKANKEILLQERTRLEQLLKDADEFANKEDKKKEMLSRVSSVLDILKDDTIDNTHKANALRSIVDHMVYNNISKTLDVYFKLVE